MSGFHLYTSNRLENLSERLAEMLRADPLPPLEREIIVVQSKGMEQWLSLEIATRNGICANCAFPFPRSFVYDVFRELRALPEQSPYAPEIMTWKIMGVLPGLLDNPAFSSLKQYIQGDNGELKLFQLSEKIAAVFDRYLVYRPDIITEWDRGKNSIAAAFSHCRWQAELWRRITPPDGSLDHPAALKNMFIERMEQGIEIKNLPSRISVFGISTLPPYYIELLTALSRMIAVHVFYLNPCRQYWEYAYSKKEIARIAKAGLTEEDQYFDGGNSLLASMGASAREFFSLILNTVGDTGEDLFGEPGETTILGRIQSDILELRDRKHDDLPGAGYDPSIQIHSCHSPIREVEVLYDNLLNLFDVKDNLLPKDIAVMMPDIAAYAPFIQAVLDTPEDESMRIPYSLADTSIQQESTVAAAFLAILGLDRERFRASAMLDILGTEAVHKKFHLAEKDLEIITTWVRDSGICWGIDKDYRRELGLPGFHENTWRFGLDRMLLGYALPETDSPRLFSGIRPYNEIEGDGARVLGAFAQFADTLFHYAGQLRKERSLVEWSDELSRILDLFFLVTDETEHEIKEIRDALTENGLAGFARASGFDEKVSLDIIRACLAQYLETSSRPHGFISHGVTFCTMLPMRSIPFKVVYILGMNDGDYPRSSPKPGFDLTDKHRRLCDRSRRLEDRYLFLETVLSARENLIISYVGRSSKDNTEIPPSVLVCELIDYVGQAFGEAVRADMIMQHPLQPFSSRYFTRGKEKLFTYSNENYLAAAETVKNRREIKAFLDRPLAEPVKDEWKSISIEQLCAFFANPCEFLVKNRLNTGLRLEEFPEPGDREPFEIDGLEKYFLTQEIVDACLEGRADSLFEFIRASGKLPPGSSGVSEYQALQHVAAAFSREVEACIRGGAEPVRDLLITLDRPEISIRAVSRNIYPRGQIFFRCAAIKARDMLSAWIWHLVLHCSDETWEGRETVFIGRGEQFAFAPLEKAMARERLANLADYFLQGLAAPLCFFPETSYAYSKALLVKEKNDADALMAAKKKWETGYTAPGEGDDIYIRTCFGNEMPQREAFKEIARLVFEPMLAQMKKE